MKGLGRKPLGSCGPWSFWLLLCELCCSLPSCPPSSLSDRPAGCLPPTFGAWQVQGHTYREPRSSHPPHVPSGPSRSRASSESELDDEGPCGGDGDPGLFPFPLPRGGAQASSEESEEEGTSDDLHLPTDCHYATRPPRPQAVRTWGRDLRVGSQSSWPTMWGGGQILREGALPVFQAPLTMCLPSASSSAPLGAGW